jgi:hypothetical protein
MAKTFFLSSSAFPKTQLAWAMGKREGRRDLLGFGLVCASPSPATGTAAAYE